MRPGDSPQEPEMYQEPLFARFEPFHSDFQIDRFIVARGGGTLYGAYQQAVRECYQRLQSITVVVSSWMSQRGPRQCSDPALVSKRGLKDSRSEENSVLAKFRLIEFNDSCRELVRLLAHVVVLKRRLGPMNREERRRYESETWRYRACAAVTRDLIQSGRISAEAIDLVLALPDEAKTQILSEVFTNQGRTALLEWYLGSPRNLPSVEPLLNELDGLSVAEKIRCLCRLWRELECDSGSSTNRADGDSNEVLPERFRVNEVIKSQTSVQSCPGNCPGFEPTEGPGKAFVRCT